MTTQEVAFRYYELACQNKWNEIQETLHDESIISREPENRAPAGIETITRGKVAVKVKTDTHRAMIETMHSRHTSEPLVAGNFFTTVLKRDVTYKGRPRAISEEIAVIEVKNGKIVSETFFY
ncbi:nuclear transport factor 2 family protein [Flavitalea sp. BT771]|uniref:SnoaL-like domain-containing protein n=1 Tax=Flavitalea sp. BT771 TaxID=3063329 RepID=UPI0026E2B2A0|nr:SnoaL-like domain-containing protein [Flavitalea sp. BT771]MDO6433649.1 nuclear transport factor 2 family protein [Flavitalea sp. BT771]MDV6222446.1 SnoaL-like domain-containing protein [Flavitalea sp. BT771]